MKNSNLNLFKKKTHAIKIKIHQDVIEYSRSTSLIELTFRNIFGIKEPEHIHFRDDVPDISFLDKLINLVTKTNTLAGSPSVFERSVV